jgi:hypothetical protein
MKTSFLASLAIGLGFVAPNMAMAADEKKPCDTKELQQKAAKLAAVYTALGVALFTDHCSELKRVMKMVMGEVSEDGGRKLKPMSGLDLDRARAQYAKALANPEFVADLKTASAHLTDPIVRKIIEAALLEDYEYFEAQKLLVQELRAAGGVSQ